MPPSRQPGGVMLAAAGPALLCLCLTASPLPSPQSPDGQTVQTAARAVGAAQPANSVQPASGHSTFNISTTAAKICPSGSPDDYPLCDQFDSDKVFEWLPLWRWTRTTWLFSDLGADESWLVRKVGIGSIADLFVGLVVQLPLQLAGFIWELTSYLMYLALTPTFYTRLFYFTYGKAAELWTQNFRPLLMGGTGATMWAALLVIGVILAMWQMLKSRTAAGAGSKLPWMQAFGTLMRVLIPLTLVYMMVTNPTGELGPQKIMERTVRYTDYLADPLKNGVMAFTSKIGSRDIATACGAYKETLEEIFVHAWNNQTTKLRTEFDTLTDTTVASGSDEIELAKKQLEDLKDELKDKYIDRYATDSSSVITVSTRTPGVRAFLPILASRMWENGFHHGVGMAQFGDPVAASRGTCYLSEWRARSTSAAEQQAIFNLSNSIHPNISGTAGQNGSGQIDDTAALAAEDRLHPDGNKAERSLLILAAACGLIQPVRVSTNVPTPSDETYEPNSGDPIQLKVTGYPNVWLDPAWAGVFNNKTRALFWSKDYAISYDTCAAWAGSPSNCSPCTTNNKPDWDKANYGNSSRDVTGVRASWVQDRADITVGDLNRSLETRRGQTMNAYEPSAEDVKRVREIVNAIQGENIMKRILFAVVAVLTAIVFLYSLGGLTLGVLVAQFVLALILMMLPVLVFAAAFPHAGARKLQKKLIRVWIFASLSYAIFFVTLAVLMLLITLIHSIAVAALPTSEGGLLDILLTPFTVLLAVKLLKSVAKTFGGDITSFKGAMEFTSGMAAAGVKLPDPKTFAADTMKPLTSPTVKGIKMARETKHYIDKANERDPKTGRKKGFVGGSLNEVWKNKVMEPLEAKTRSGAVKYRKEIDDDAYRLSEVETQTEGYANKRERLRDYADTKEQEQVHRERAAEMAYITEQQPDPITGALQQSTKYKLEQMEEIVNNVFEPKNAQYTSHAGQEITDLAQTMRALQTALQDQDNCILNKGTPEEQKEAEDRVARLETQLSIEYNDFAAKYETLNASSNFDERDTARFMRPIVEEMSTKINNEGTRREHERDADVITNRSVTSLETVLKELQSRK